MMFRLLLRLRITSAAIIRPRGRTGRQRRKSSQCVCVAHRRRKRCAVTTVRRPGTECRLRRRFLRQRVFDLRVRLCMIAIRRATRRDRRRFRRRDARWRVVHLRLVFVARRIVVVHLGTRCPVDIFTFDRKFEFRVHAGVILDRREDRRNTFRGDARRSFRRYFETEVHANIFECAVTEIIQRRRESSLFGATKSDHRGHRTTRRECEQIRVPRHRVNPSTLRDADCRSSEILEIESHDFRRRTR